MNKRQENEIAASLDATPDLLPFIPELLADLWLLGGSLEVIVNFIRKLDLRTDSTRVLGLGCGKGAISITLAKAFGFRVDGIDYFEPFIKDAMQRAEKEGVANLCKFTCGDLRDVVQKTQNYDIVIYASVGNTLGPLDQCVKKLRQTVRPSGYIILDDVFLNNKTTNLTSNYQYVTTYDETMRMILSQGDRIVREEVISTEKMREVNAHYTELIRSRATDLAKRNPDFSDLILNYVKKQEEECRILETEVTGVVWLLQVV